MTSYIISAAPSRGKSYIATSIAVDLLKDGKTVFSNYPIVYQYPLSLRDKIINIYRKVRKIPLIQHKEISTYKWIDDYVDMGIHDATIILDEAYKIVNCHDRLTDSQHDFFATTGHNNVDIYIIAQNYRRINVVIREMAMFLIISKFSNPLALISKEGRKELTPLFFTVDYFLSERDYMLKGIKKDALFQKKRVFFKKDIANAYNTQFYRRREKPIEKKTWIQSMEEEDINSLQEIKREEPDIILEKPKKEKVKSKKKKDEFDFTQT